MSTNKPSDSDNDDVERLQGSDRTMSTNDTPVADDGDVDEPRRREKTTLFRTLRSNGHTELLVERFADGSVVLSIFAMDDTVAEELTPHESLQLIAAILPDPATPDPARRKSARSSGSREEGKP